MTYNHSLLQLIFIDRFSIHTYAISNITAQVTPPTHPPPPPTTPPPRKTWNHEIVCFKYHTALKFDKWVLTHMPNLRSIRMYTNLKVSRSLDIFQLHSLSYIGTGFRFGSIKPKINDWFWSLPSIKLPNSLSQAWQLWRTELMYWTVLSEKLQH